MSNQPTKGRLIQIAQSYTNGGDIRRLESGEFGLGLDEGQERLYIGSNSGNIQVVTERNIAQLAVPDGSIGRSELDGEVNTLLDSISSVTNIPEATTSQKGLMSSGDKTKLNSIETGANNTVIVNNLTSLSTTSALSAYQGKLLKDMIDNGGGSSGGSANVIDNLTSTDTTSSLSANQGRVLKGLIDGKAGTTTATTSANGLMSASDKQKLDNISGTGGTTVVNTLTSTSTTDALSAYQGKVLNESKLSGYQVGVSRSSTGNAMGYYANASRDNTFAFGYNAQATGDYSIAFGYNAVCSGAQSLSIGLGNEATGLVSTAIGKFNEASGECSTVVGGINGKSTGLYSSVFGGESNEANGAYSAVLGGRYNKALNFASTAIGVCSNMTLTNATSYSSSSDAFVIGNGYINHSSDYNYSNAFRVRFNGSVYGRSAYNSSGADYAEYFEWLDGNVDNEDRVGYFVTLKGDKIRKANSTDAYILGIISANPSVVGDASSEGWSEQYIRDEFGRVQYHYVDVPHEELDENGEKVTVIKNEYHPIYNPQYNPQAPYTPREERKEWDAVGMMGKLLVRDDGSCEVNGYCSPNDDGIATKSDEGYRVMKRVSDNIVQVLVK